MQSFNRYVTEKQERLLLEINLKSFFSKILNFFKSLGFGQSKVYSFSLVKEGATSKGNGTLNELCTAYQVALKLKQSGLRVNNDIGFLKSQYEGLKRSKPREDVKKIEKLSEMMADSLVEEVTAGEDVKLLEFEVLDASKGGHDDTCDIQIQKMKEGEVRDVISASLKVGLKGSVLLGSFVHGSGGVYLGLFNLLDYLITGNRVTGKKKQDFYLKKFIDDNGKFTSRIKEIKMIDKAYTNTRLAQKNNAIPPRGYSQFLDREYCEIARIPYKEGIVMNVLLETFFEILENRTITDKSNFIKRFLNGLDMDALSSSIYAGIYDKKSKSLKFATSTASPRFKKLVEAELSKLDVNITRSGRSNILFGISYQGETLLEMICWVKRAGWVQFKFADTFDNTFVDVNELSFDTSSLGKLRKNAQQQELPLI